MGPGTKHWKWVSFLSLSLLVTHLNICVLVIPETLGPAGIEVLVSKEETLPLGDMVKILFSLNYN